MNKAVQIALVVIAAAAVSAAAVQTLRLQRLHMDLQRAGIDLPEWLAAEAALGGQERGGVFALDSASENPENVPESAINGEGSNEDARKGDAESDPMERLITEAIEALMRQPNGLDAGSSGGSDALRVGKKGADNDATAAKKGRAKNEAEEEAGRRGPGGKAADMSRRLLHDAREAIKSGGITNIPGVRIFERAEVRVRSVG